MQGLLNLVWEHLLPGLHTGALPQDAASESQLRRELEVLCLAPPLGVPGAQPTPAGGRFLLEPNSLGAVGARFHFTDRSCDFTLEHSAGSSTIRCGVGRWNRGSSDMPGTPPLAPWDDFGARSRHLPVPVAAAGAWTQERTLEMQWRYYESGNRDTVTCRFEGERVEIEFQNSVSLLMASRPETRPILTGHRIPQR
jgi:hypothetical protein